MALTSIIPALLGFSSMMSCPPCEPPSMSPCPVAPPSAPSPNGTVTCEEPFLGVESPITEPSEATATIYATCGTVKAAYEEYCCGAEADEQFFPYKADPSPLFVKPGSHLAHAETFSGTKIFSLITASECSPALPEHAWQADPRSPAGVYCAVGAMDGLNAMPVLGDGTFQTVSTGKPYMRTFINTEITRSPSDDRTPHWYISTVEDKGGFGQPDPAESERLAMYGALEQFFDFDRTTLEAVNGGQAIKKVYTANKVPFNEPFDPTLTADQIFGIVTTYSELHNNVQPEMTERYEPDCSPESDARSCGLNGHCGSKIALKHEFSYETAPGVPAYGETEGVGFEDDVLLIAEEGHPLSSWEGAEAITGTVQALDIRTGNLYQLPQLSVGVIEMAFTVSTGNPDYIAVGIEEYGVSEYNGTTGGSRWNLWIGRKNKESDNFLERNGLAPNSGRVYVFVADSGETDMATFLGWPQSGKPEEVFERKPGRFEPIAGAWDGDYKTWTAGKVNTMKTVQGNSPVFMTGRAKQEWGSVNPDAPNQWVIAETGLGGSQGGRARGCEERTEDCEMGTSSSTLAFLEADFTAAFAAMDGSFTARNPAISLPQSIPGAAIDVMADQVYHGPHREGERGLADVDSVLWMKGNKVLAAEDSDGPGGFNMGVLYDKDARKSVPIVGAIGRNGPTMAKMNAVAMAPYGSFSGPTNQEMTGFYDASAALSVAVPYTPQMIYDSSDAKHVIVDNQMKGSAGPMREGFYYTAQCYQLILPDIDFSTYPTSPTTLNLTAEAHFVTQYGKFRRGLNGETFVPGKPREESTVCSDEWPEPHQDGDEECHWY